MFVETKKLQKQFTKVGGSTARFHGKFKEELAKTIDIIWSTIEADIWEDFVFDSISSGNNNIKMIIHAKDVDERKNINCIFRYHHDDEWFGNVNIELVLSELSEKTKTRFVGKYSVLDRAKIKKDIVADILTCLKI